VSPDRTINDALGLKPETEPIAACMDFSALNPEHFIPEALRLMHRHPLLSRPAVHSSQMRTYLSRSVVERLTGGAA
jgi:hypothetical protein